jgi:23S rRNA (cytosine1962-C5)-methyltransferase
MFDSADYELLDFGAGRKLERFASTVLDRPSPAAGKVQPSNPQLWSTADARFELDASPKSGPVRGRWKVNCDPPMPWTIGHGAARLELKLTDFGHVGVFPEQGTMWDWIAVQAEATRHPYPNPLPKGEGEIRVLNLFAYTGGSTIAAAAVGAAITHVDAARNVVDWARRNAQHSGLSAAPIRWIADDALSFAKRELKRGRHYDGMILDPPSYGHGPGGETWKIDDHLPELLSICCELTAREPRFVLLTSHAADYDPPRLAGMLVEAGFEKDADRMESGELSLATRDGRSLLSGTFARVSCQTASDFVRPTPDS